MSASVVGTVFYLLSVLYVRSIKYYLDKILNSDEVTSVAVLHLNIVQNRCKKPRLIAIKSV